MTDLIKCFLHNDFPQFYNDICEVVRLFIEKVEFMPADSGSESSTHSFFLGCAHLETELRISFAQGKVTYKETAKLPKDESPLMQKRLLKRLIKQIIYKVLKNHFDAPTPWGCLTGIRPTKLARSLMEQHGVAHMQRILSEDFFVQPSKISLATRIIQQQEPIFASIQSNDIDLYVGIPFCSSRCSYCSFTAYTLANGQVSEYDIETYHAFLLGEITRNVKTVLDLGYRIRCVYVGGGTPTILPPTLLQTVLETIQESCGGFGVECTVEAGRPDTIDLDKLRMLKDMGVSRLSINPQSMNAHTLARVGRAHSPEEIATTFEWARKTGFDNINMDIIIGLPGETPEDVVYTMQEIQKLQPDHLTVHALAIKSAARLKTDAQREQIPQDTIILDMAQIAEHYAHNMRLLPYYLYRQKYMRGNLENVGYAKHGCICIYNIDMMEEAVSILALGAGAISKRVYPAEGKIERIANPKNLQTYYEKADKLYQDRYKLWKNPMN